MSLLKITMLVTSLSGLQLNFDAPPTQGEQTVLRWTVEEGQKAQPTEWIAYYRQNARPSLQHSQTLTTTPTLDGHQGELSWTPKEAGIVQLQGRDSQGNTMHSEVIAVAFKGIPWGGLAIAIFAGILLVGGSTWLMIRMLSSEASAA